MRISMKIAVAFSIIIILTAGIGCEKNESGASTSDEPFIYDTIRQTINDFPYEELSDEEVVSLLQMREEEKLAYDVYDYLYDKYGMRIFSNIKDSEETHMFAVKLILDKYEQEDPVQSDERGAFTDADINNLYQLLTAKGDSSLLDALIVGATIEDLDIKDLMDLSENVNNQDILYVYDNLTLGSRNHLRSFYTQILNNGGTYQPQYITQELFDSIINSAHEVGSW